MDFSYKKYEDVKREIRHFEHICGIINKTLNNKTRKKNNNLIIQHNRNANFNVRQ